MARWGLGLNGAGKSTTMRMITQYFEPDTGIIRLDGTSLIEAGREAKRRIGYLPENNPLYPEMLVSEWLDYVAGLRGLRGPERHPAMDEAIAATGIEDGVSPADRGAVQGLPPTGGLAIGHPSPPRPPGARRVDRGLDPNQRVEIRRLIAPLGRERTVMLSTHVLPEVQFTCSRLLIINRGRIVADGRWRTWSPGPRTAAGIRVEASGPGVADRLADLPGVRGVEARAGDEGAGPGHCAVAGCRSPPAGVRPGEGVGVDLFELHQEAEASRTSSAT